MASKNSSKNTGKNKAPSNPEDVATLFGLAAQLAKICEAETFLVWTQGTEDWDYLKRLAGTCSLLVASDDTNALKPAVDAGLDVLTMERDSSSISDRISQALLKAVSDDILSPGAGVVALYSAFNDGTIDSVSLVKMIEYLDRLTARDLRSIKSRVPLNTLKRVIDLAIEIGREGREGKPIGAMFIVGDTRNVMARSTSAGFDPVRGYTRKERSLHDARVREGIKEVCQLDGAMIVSSDGTVEAGARLLESSGAALLTLSKGLGARHMAAAAITKNTTALAVTVSESNGTVRLFQNGRVMLRVEPFRRAMRIRVPPPESSSSLAD